MGKFGHGAFRQDKTVKGLSSGKGIPRSYKDYPEMGKFFERTRGGNYYLNNEGKRELRRRNEALAEKRGDVPKALARRRRHLGLDLLFKKPRPLSFKTKDGKRVRILMNGIENLFLGQKDIPGRALICVLVNGKQLFFYRSSGASSNMAGEWFPTRGAEVFYPREKGAKLELGHITKMEGHPMPHQKNPKTNFAPWIDEIREKIKLNERKLILHKNWGAEAYLDFIELLGKIPPTNELNLQAAR